MLIDEVDKIGCGIKGDPGLLVCLIFIYLFSILALNDRFFESMVLPLTSQALKGVVRLHRYVIRSLKETP